ncbi:hypothetical protein GGQ91_004793 [Methylobacterium fujisawaense]|uniref:Uncharacterized protein n=1 Tax=Methylobacterium fujisawaense TaxID=107400 RepID=A0ABR6DH09_9HYPH|nr:hypothetical protein [Methylobacterium fujisawaense]
MPRIPAGARRAAWPVRDRVSAAAEAAVPEAPPPGDRRAPGAAAGLGPSNAAASAAGRVSMIAAGPSMSQPITQQPQPVLRTQVSRPAWASIQRSAAATSSASSTSTHRQARLRPGAGGPAGHGSLRP